MLCSDCDKTRHLQWLASMSASNVTVNQRPLTQKSESKQKQSAHSSVTKVYYKGKPAASNKKNEMKNEASVGSILLEEICDHCQTPCDSTIRCDVCLLKFDNECCNLPSEVFITLRSIISSTGWVCQDCRSACRSKIAQIQCTQSEMAEKLSDTFASLAYLQDEVQQLKTHSSTDASKAGKSTGAVQSDSYPASNQGDISTNVPTAVIESTVLNTLTDRERRKQNLIITGLPESNDNDDTEQAEYLFVKICEEHLNLKPLPVHQKTQRLGKKNEDGKPRRLFVKLQSENCVKDVLAAAKSLRLSDDEYVRKSVYINADLSPAEAKLAYEKRQKRRERLAQQRATAVITAEPIDEVAARDYTCTVAAQQHSASHSRVEEVNNVVSDDPEIAFKDTVHVPDTRRDVLDTVDSSNNHPFR